MEYGECREYMKRFFEQYYQKLKKQEIALMLPLDEAQKAMWSDDTDPEKEWKTWKRVPPATTIIF